MCMCLHYKLFTLDHKHLNYCNFFGLHQAFISTRRLGRFLSCSEHQYEQRRLAGSPFGSGHMAVVMEDGCCDWSSSKSEQLNMVLNHVTLALPKGSLVAIIGEVKFFSVLTSSTHQFLCTNLI